jgi:hypothetical protein
MPSRFNQLLFNEPAGRPNTVVMFAGAVSMLSIYIYYGILRDGMSSYPLLLAIGFALSGIAESLPAEQRLLAGGVRVTAVSWLLGLLAVTILAPELIL